MKQKAILGIVSLYCLLVFACSNPVQKESVETLILTGNNFQDVKLNLSDYADSVWYIRPEFKEDCFPGGMLHCRISEKKIIVVDQFQRIFVYDFDGKLVTYLNMKGRGPGEYISLLDVQIHEGKIVVLDRSKYLNFYSLDGEFLKKITLAAQITDFIFSFDGELIGVTPPPFCDIDLDGHRFSQVDESSGKTIKKYHQQPPDKYKPGETLKGKIQIFPRSGGFVYFEPGIDTVYNIDIQNQESKPCYSIDYNQAVRDLPSGTGKNLSLQSVFETDRYRFLRFFAGRGRKDLFLEKESNSGGNLVFNYSLIDNGFHNDIDGGYPFWPAIQIDENTLATPFNPSEFKVKYSNSYFSNIIPKYPDRAADFRERIESLDDVIQNYNLWIMVVKFKQ